MPPFVPEVVAEAETSEQRRVQILEMIVRNEPAGSILQAIACDISAEPEISGVAILVVRGDRLEPAAIAGLRPHLISQLGDIGLADLVDPCRSVTKSQVALECSLRALISGAGELLGAIVLELNTRRNELAEYPALEALEKLAVFAIEHDNMLAELTWRAEHDPLTEVGNRQWFDRRLASAAYECRRGAAGFAVACLNIDHFRLINDVLGFRTGNMLLREIAARLKAGIGPEDAIARASGNEFFFLISRVGTPDEARAAGEMLLSCLAEPFLIDGHELFVSASAGITLVGADDSGSEEPQSGAYAAMASARARGRNQTVLFDFSMLQDSRERLEIGCHLRNALPKRELEVYYQPQVNIKTGETIGAEALLRWKHPDIGFVSPARFIPMAEDSGLITEFGEWVIAEVIRHCAEWKRAGIAPGRLAVNISPAHFLREDFARRLERLLDRAAPDSPVLELEVTETILMANLDHARDVMSDLARFGVMFAIDDFGTGHSSLAYLHRLPVQRLKIAQHFIREIPAGAGRPTLLANIIRMARELNVACIAEGIETEAQASALVSIGCNEAQGYLYSKPLPAADFERWLRAKPKKNPRAQNETAGFTGRTRENPAV